MNSAAHSRQRKASRTERRDRRQHFCPLIRCGSFSAINCAGPEPSATPAVGDTPDCFSPSVCRGRWQCYWRLTWSAVGRQHYSVLTLAARLATGDIAAEVVLRDFRIFRHDRFRNISSTLTRPCGAHHLGRRSYGQPHSLARRCFRSERWPPEPRVVRVRG